jgi:hypothetical protein
LPKSLIVSPFGLDSGCFPGGTHFISGDIRFEPIEDATKLRLIEYLDGVHREDLSRLVRVKPVYVIPIAAYNRPKGATEDADADDVLQIHKFALETFTASSVPMAAFEFDGDKILSHVFDKQDLISATNAGVQMGAGTWNSHVTFLRFLYERIGAADTAILSIRRLCRANKSGPTPDGIIDLAIALECLVSAQNEIKFQFSLSHALTNSDEPDRRAADFELFQSVYDVRSRVVHGGAMNKSDKTKLAKIVESWRSLIEITRNSITYYLHFCHLNGSAEWALHLRKLALGSPRIGLGALE